MTIDRQLDLFDDDKNRRIRRKFLEFCYDLVATGQVTPKPVKKSTLAKVRKNISRAKSKRNRLK